MRISFRILVLNTIVAAALSGCATGQYLKTEEVLSPELSGTYTLILHGGRYAADFQNVAILDREGDSFSIGIYAPVFDYKVRSGLPADRAIEEAEKFVRFHYAARSSQWKKILGTDNSLIGYEVRPLYEPLETGYPDILDITYVTRGKKIIARISFKHDLERGILREDEGPLIRKMR
ncbi:MAG: hypothetical protein EPN25_10370 [Nitrospirae bacterium]|nr:MAG: hypothetical protein EPN25_10370 [Nitrospirota bacterium]